MTIHEISRDEYMAGLQSEVQKNGLLDAVKKRLDEINHVALTLNYANWGLVQEMSVEIIDLLKAQEPRVMTLEELVAWQKQPITARDPIYVEYREGKGFGAPHWAQDNFGFNVASCSDNYRSGAYGMLIRCWTSRPDEKRRTETPWE